MNLADLTSVLVLLSGAIAPVAYAGGKGASWWMIVICGAVGCGVGVGAAHFFGRSMYWFLRREWKAGRQDWLGFAGYVLLPVPAVLGTLAISIWLTSLVIS